ncbi:MAG: DUF1800 family protein [Acidobacteria bacterium]|nr:DUF1800 family protein [Acidobacteriota bacterium]
MKRKLSYSILFVSLAVCLVIPAGLLLPVAASAQTQLSIVSAASYEAGTLAPEAMASAFGARLATTTNVATVLPLPTVLGGATVKVKDSAGTERAAALFFVSPTQVNFQLPTGTALGTALVTIRSGDGTVSLGNITVAKVAPSLFTANATGRGVAAANFLRIKPNNVQSYEPVGRFDATQSKFIPVPVNLGPETEQVYLVLYGTGARFHSGLAQIAAKLGATPVEIISAGAQGALVGLDQINLRVPRDLTTCGTLDVTLTIDGKLANKVQVAVGALSLSAPTGLAAAAGANEATLSWNTVTGAAAYKVKRATASGGPFTTIATVSRPAHTDTALTNGTTYFYVVGATGCAGETANSNVAAATPLSQNTGPALYLAALTPEGTAQSGGSGVATLLLGGDEKSGTVRFNFANLTTPKMAAHVHGPADPGTSGSILFDLDDAPREADGAFRWTFANVGTVTAAQIVAALKTGRLYVNIHSSRYPGGEIRGHFRLANGSQTFTPPAAAPPLPSGTPTPREAARFLTQATFGPAQTDLDRLPQLGYQAWLNEQFSAPLVSHVAYLDAAKAAGVEINTHHTMEPWWAQALAGRDQLRARVVFALSQIFVISNASGPLEGEAFALSSYLDMLNRNAFGNFRQLLEEVTLHPAMGAYLNLLQNDREDPATGREPNENFAREVLQLFSIGLYQLNPDGTLKLDAGGLPVPTYNQTTIENFAKVFTGWNHAGNDQTKAWKWQWPDRNWRAPLEAWVTHHSTGEKVLLNGARLPANQTPQKDLKDALDNIFNHPNVGPFIARQLIQRLVTSNPSPGYVYRVANVFDNNGAGVRGDLKAVVRAILLDYEARSPDVIGNQGFGKQREPVLRFSALLRAFNVRSNTGKFRIWNLESPLWGMGQNPLYAPTVFNFFQPGYAQPGAMTEAGLVAPEFQITTETSIIGSSNTLRGVAFRGLTWDQDQLTLDYTVLLPLAVNPGNPGQLLDKLNLLLLANALTSETRARLLTVLNTIAASDQLGRVQMAVYLILLSPEFAIQR